MQPEERKAVADLISRHFDGLLDEAQEKELSNLLDTSAEARAMLVSLMKIEGDLALLGEVKQAKAPVRAGRRRPWVLALAASLAIAAGIGYWFFSSPDSAWIARMERVEGSVEIASRSARSGDPLFSGEALDLGARSRATLRFRDGTVLALAADTRVGKIEETQGAKRVRLTRGSVRAEVVKQPQDGAMVFETPHGVAKVLGTTLRIAVDPDPKVGMRLEVEKGKVDLRRLADSKTVLVESGHYAVVAAGVELIPKPLGAGTNRLKVLSRDTFRTRVKGVGGVALSRDGASLALGGADGTVAVVDAATGVERVALAGHPEAVRWVAFAPDSGLLASGDQKNNVILWTLPRGERRAEFGAPELLDGFGLQALAFSPDGRTLATRSSTSIRLWDSATGQPKSTVLRHPGADPLVHCIAFSPDGRLVSGARQGKIILWDIGSGQKTAELSLSISQAVWAAFSPDGKRLAAGGGYGGTAPHLKFWDVATGREEPADVPEPTGTVFVWTAAFSPDGRTLARLDGDGTVLVWEVVDRQELLRVPGRTGRVFVGFARGGKALLLVNEDGTFEVWSLGWENR